MRWLILSDIHGDLSALELILALSGPVDLLLVAGDLTHFGDIDEAKAAFSVLAQKNSPILAVSGNCDRDGVRMALESADFSVEGRSKEFRGFTFAGAGGGIRHHGMTPFEATEDELEASLSAALDSCDRVAGSRLPGERLVIITHTPPNGTPLDRRGSSHTGSHAFRGILGERSPFLWVSGHIHEARSLCTIGNSVLVNPGSVHDGFFASAEVDGTRPPLVRLESIDRSRGHLGE